MEGGFGQCKGSDSARVRMVGGGKHGPISLIATAFLAFLLGAAVAGVFLFSPTRNLTDNPTAAPISSLKTEDARARALRLQGEALSGKLDAVAEALKEDNLRLRQKLDELEAARKEDQRAVNLKLDEASANQRHEVSEQAVNKVNTMNQLNVEPGTGVTIEIGLHNHMMSPHGPKSFILGVEASMDSIVDLLLPQYRNKPNTAILNAAVFDTDGLSVFQLMSGWTASNTLVVDAGLSKLESRFKVTSQDPVATITLDHLIDAVPDHSRLDLLKVDVQGVNYNVLKSAGKKILRARAVFSECTRDNKKLELGGETSVDIYGNSEDLCGNHKSYMENMGFVYLGHFVESETDLSGDQAFAHPDFLERAKPCIKTMGGTMNKQDRGERKDLGDVEDCLGAMMLDADA